MSPRIHVLSAIVAVSVVGIPLTVVLMAQSGRHYPLESAAGLRLAHVTAEAAVHRGRSGVRIAMADGTAGVVDDFLAVIDGPAFGNGTIEAEIAGAPQTGAFEGARGFVGIAFRVLDDRRTYDAFYLRPTNGRADDQLRRNHSAQYISHPAWTWSRLRSETPGLYESYVDLVPDEWTKVKIEVRGAQARLYVHDQPQPALVVNDLKTGADGRGAIALWIDVGTVAHFRNLTVTQDAGR